MAYDNAGGQGDGASTTTVNQLVTYAQGNGKALADCQDGRCKSVFYMNPNHVWNNTPSSCISHPDAEEMGASSESWFVHNTGYSDAAHRVYGRDGSGCQVWLLNPNSAGVQAWWSNYLRTNADNYDVYFLDANQMTIPNEGYFPASGGGCMPWPSICHSTREIPDNPSEVLAHVSFVNGMNHQNGSPMHFLFQQASFNIATDISAFTATSRFMGITCEGCISTFAAPVRPTLYVSVLKEMAAVNATSGAFLITSHGNAPGGSPTQILQRLITTGIAWLAYSEGHTIVQPDLETNTNSLPIWPEDLIYPAAPIQSMISGPSDLQVAPGVYRREFANCFQRGIPIGQCAAVVNSNSGSVTVQSSWFTQTYHHIITLGATDVVSGGSVNLSGASFVGNSSQLQSGGALLLSR